MKNLDQQLPTFRNLCFGKGAGLLWGWETPCVAASLCVWGGVPNLNLQGECVHGKDRKPYLSELNLGLLPRKLSPKQVRRAQYFNHFNFELKYFPGGGIYWLMHCLECPNTKATMRTLLPLSFPLHNQRHWPSSVTSTRGWMCERNGGTIHLMLC